MWKKDWTAQMVNSENIVLKHVYYNKNKHKVPTSFLQLKIKRDEKTLMEE